MSDPVRENAYPHRPNGMVGRPVRDPDINKVRTLARRLKRMKDAHDQGRHWKRCNFCVGL